MHQISGGTLTSLKAACFTFALACPAVAGIEDIKPVLRPFAAVVNDVSRLAPKTRPENLVLAASRKPKKTLTGRLCGVKGLGGSEAAPVSGKIRGCGIAKPVRVTSVNGIALSAPALIDCKTAKTFDKWVKKSLQKQFKKQGGVSKIHVAASYSCRSRNNRPGAKLSEHSFGHAIDISGFTLANGERVTVLNDWRKRPHSKALRALHKGACGPFGTVLGPESDRYHQDHFHFDTARYRSGSYCR